MAEIVVLLLVLIIGGIKDFMDRNKDITNFIALFFLKALFLYLTPAATIIWLLLDSHIAVKIGFPLLLAAIICICYYVDNKKVKRYVSIFAIVFFYIFGFLISYDYYYVQNDSDNLYMILFSCVFSPLMIYPLEKAADFIKDLLHGDEAYLYESSTDIPDDAFENCLQLCQQDDFDPDRLSDYCDGETDNETSADDNTSAYDTSHMIFLAYCADILSAVGYEVDVLPQYDDDRIDLIAHKDGIKHGIRCECDSSKVDDTAILKAFFGKKCYDCHVGIVMTNQYFPDSSKEFAESNGIVLWDKDTLNQFQTMHKNLEETAP